jgi:hypothetical protein
VRVSRCSGRVGSGMKLGTNGTISAVYRRLFKGALEVACIGISPTVGRLFRSYRSKSTNNIESILYTPSAMVD